MYDAYKEVRQAKTPVNFIVNQWDASIDMYFKKGTYTMDGENVVVRINAGKLAEAVNACLEQL